MKAIEITDKFGCCCFNDKVMKSVLSPSVYKALRRVIDEGEELTADIADEVAAAMKNWAISLGATHYTHWFMPMTGATAEKHNAFVMPSGGGVIMDFTGKMLIKGEADASSFPSGGLRATFEARGYTAWDCTSTPFVRKLGDSGAATLCIPTAFCSFTGEALDDKTPLLRSMEAINKEALRVLNILGVKAKSVTPTVGAEQEYFLIDKDLYLQRKDLVYTGRTLFGAPPARGQELEDQYYASMSERIGGFMAELNDRLWELGIPAQTQHYEAAPAQYEMAPVFETCNIAVDHNALAMDVLQKVAGHHGFTCLLHEKPFDYVNGSGKHDNWALCTDTGRNLLAPAKKPDDEQGSLVFLTFLTAVIAAVDEYSHLLRMCCATPGNARRLGGNEAPPAIISIFTGDKIYEQLESLENGGAAAPAQKERMKTGVKSLPVLFKDDSDRNRTSAFAFTGNKFEFRMVGSSQALGMPNTVINTIVAKKLAYIAGIAENAADPVAELRATLGKLVHEHKRVVFNGNNYSNQWLEEAKRRGLPVIHSTVDAILALDGWDCSELFASMNVFTQPELQSRKEVYLKSYIKHASIEAVTMIKLARQRLLPAVVKYCSMLAEAKNKAVQAGAPSEAITEMLAGCTAALDEFKHSVDELDIKLGDTLGMKKDSALQARCFEESVMPAMNKTRMYADTLEKQVGKEYWPMPSYGEMLFYIV